MNKRVASEDEEETKRKILEHAALFKRRFAELDQTPFAQEWKEIRRWAIDTCDEWEVTLEELLIQMGLGNVPLAHSCMRSQTSPVESDSFAVDFLRKFQEARKQLVPSSLKGTASEAEFAQDRLERVRGKLMQANIYGFRCVQDEKKRVIVLMEYVQPYDPEAIKRIAREQLHGIEACFYFAETILF